MRLRCAVVTTRDRPGDYRDCVAAIAPQVDSLVTVSHMDPAYVWDVMEGTREQVRALQVIPYFEDPPNISRMWNLGLSSAPYLAEGRHYDVAVLNDDAVVPPGWFEAVTAAMRTAGAVAGCSARAEDHRMSGFAFILAGEAGILVDEQFEWWYGDDDIERRAKLAGGLAQVEGHPVEHRHPNSTTIGVLAEKAAEDRLRFERKWG